MNNKSLQHVWSVLCSNSSVDQQTNNVSLYNVLEQIEVDKEAFDAKIKEPEKDIVAGITYEIISLFKKSNKDKKIVGEQKIEIIDPEAKILMDKSHSLEIPENSGRVRFRIQFQGLKLTVPGEYIFKVSIKDSETNEFETVAELPLQINSVKIENKPSPK